jgi:hypothetical protein
LKKIEPRAGSVSTPNLPIAIPKLRFRMLTRYGKRSSRVSSSLDSVAFGASGDENVIMLPARRWGRERSLKHW